MIGKNWVLKRKRKHIPYQPDSSILKKDISMPSESRNNSSKKRLKDDIGLSSSPRKKKGNDGYYFECVICDLGGNLLCCDSCPRTYHLQCLNPPLKRTPPGKWQCPKCCERKVFVKHPSHPEVISKRARSKNVLEKAKNKCKSSSLDNLPVIQNTIPGKKRSSTKVKSRLKHIFAGKKLNSILKDVSCSTNSNHLSDDAVSIKTLCESIKNDDFSCVDESTERRFSLCIDEGSLSKNVPLDGDQENPDMKSKLLHKDVSPVCKVVSLEKKAKGDAQKEKGKRKKIEKADSKKSKSSEGELSVSKSLKGKSQKKNRCFDISANQPFPPKDEQNCLTTAKEGLPNQTSTINEPSVKLPEDTSHKFPSLTVGDAAKVISQVSSLDESRQVDRILGCRVQSSQCPELVKLVISSMGSVKNVSLGSANYLQDDDLKFCDKYEVSGDDPGGNRDKQEDNETSLGKKHHITHSMDHIDEKIDIENRGHLDPCKGKMSRDEDYIDSPASTESERSQFEAVFSITSSAMPQNSAKSLSNVRDVSKEIVLIEDNLTGDNKEKLGDIFHKPDSREKPISCGPTDANDDASGLTSKDDVVKSKIKDVVGIPIDIQESGHEFLVKWVGKSHIHNTWVWESDLRILAKRKLDNYKAKYGTAIISICQEQWSQPQRIIATHSSEDGKIEALVKWCDLPYDECTWESLDAIKDCDVYLSRYNQLELQASDNNNDSHNQFFFSKNASDSQQKDVITLSEQPEELKGGSLFPHQLEALNWLRRCWHKNKNVILADEMGLGKTISACAFLSSLYSEFKARLPCLVLVPLSTMPNWLAEFSLWAPHLNVVEYHGCAKARSVIRQYEWHASKRDKLVNRTNSYKFNVLLTTYEMILADSSHLRGVPWEVLIVDEGHRLKNSESKLFSLLNTFSFQHRVLLTGTPLQNNIGEMYNLLNFLQPTSFPSLSSFEEKFSELTTAEKVDELKSLVAPHMLRRLKKDAMKNIPPKTERMVPVELTSIQAEYYRAMLTKNYQILRNIGKGIPQQSMLNIVMQLRKVCNHPYLIPGTEPDSGSVEFLQEMRIKASAKLTLLHSMLKILNKEGHRVLIFSQMTKLLDILEDYLSVEFGPKSFERVDGSVSVADRQAAITRFNQDKSRFVFLLSTRSCGLGINLASADTVVIYDSDFNPHADIQAMNRAHRIGQSNRLLVYRLVVRASVEERILQLAKKKLMLDQLFVNKSGSQKEVEDILRWGTEELFNDTNDQSNNKTEVHADTEQKHRRKLGGLGDVYDDKCTDGSMKILWDENAIERLLDRSYLQPGSIEATEIDMDNYMLGSVKSLEWNDEPIEEPGANELLPTVVADGTLQNFEKESNVSSATEENEWDRLLRLRWEKYQNEVEETLGRGKRTRKVVSYREAYTPLPNEALSETSKEEEEPIREYTLSGRAFKDKYSRLRARQKERISKRSITERQFSNEIQMTTELRARLPTFTTDPTHAIRDDELSFNLVDNQSIRPTNIDKLTTNLIISSKDGHRRFQGNNLELSGKLPGTLTPDSFLSSHQLENTSTSSAVNGTLPPVLGLCAPTASQMKKSKKSRHDPNLLRSHCRPSRTGMGASGFPLPLASDLGTLFDIGLQCGLENRTNESTLLSMDSLFGSSNIIQDDYYLSQSSAIALHEKDPDHLDKSSISLSSSKDKIALPHLLTNEKLQSKFSLPMDNIPGSSEALSTLSLGTAKSGHVPDQDLPNFKLQLNSASLAPNKDQQSFDVGQIQATFSSCDKHKNVDDMTTEGETNNLLKKRLKSDVWSEDELDSLWIGVRRHGRGNWDLMLRDSKLKFSKYRIAKDLSDKWETEQLKIVNGPQFSLMKYPPFPSFSDGTMKLAFCGNRLANYNEARSHLTDMQLGNAKIKSSQLSLPQAEPFPWKFDVRNFCGPLPFRPSLPGNASFPLELPFLQNSAAPQMNCSSTNYKQEDVQHQNKYLRLRNLFDGSSSFSHSESVKNTRPFHSSVNDEIVGSNSGTNRLPHWLREAVCAPSNCPESTLPSGVTAGSQSVPLLYGEERDAALPPFTVSDPPPMPSKDLRKILKRKRKRHKFKQKMSDFSTNKKFQENLGTNESLHFNSSPHHIPASTLEFPLVNVNLSLSPRSKSPSLSFSIPTQKPSLIIPDSPPLSSPIQREKSGMFLPPSSEVLSLVASCIGSAPSLVSQDHNVPSTSFSRIERYVDKICDSDDHGQSFDLIYARGKHMAESSSPLFSHRAPCREDHTLQVESDDSSETQSDPHQMHQSNETEEVSSEQTVSDHESEPNS